MDKSGKRRDVTIKDGLLSSQISLITMEYSTSTHFQRNHKHTPSNKNKHKHAWSNVKTCLLCPVATVLWFWMSALSLNFQCCCTQDSGQPVNDAVPALSCSLVNEALRHDEPCCPLLVPWFSSCLTCRVNACQCRIARRETCLRQYIY